MRLFILFIVALTSISARETAFKYIHPSPGAEYISPSVSIIIRPAEGTDLSGIKIIATGEESGLHEGKLIRSGETIIFDLYHDFIYGEKVNITIFSGITKTGNFNYSFFISPHEVFNSGIREYLEKKEAEIIPGSMSPEPESSNRPRVINGISVPSDFPSFSASTMGTGIAHGKLFLNNWNGAPYIMILENDGTPYFYRKVEERARDFKVQPSGMLTRRYRANLNCFVGMDSTYTIIDTFACANDYGTDEHEMTMDTDGSYYLIALGYRTVDMSQIVPGGREDATVVDNHVQGFDPDGNLIFEWLSHENFNITDAVHENLTENWIDYVHMNSIAVDYDGNIITSSRHLSEVTKIDVQTGEMIWRFGGENNQFQLPDGDEGISYQHDARPVPGKPGYYTVFDNGNHKQPSYTRAVEYHLDTVNMTAEKVWEYRHNPEIYTGWMGNAQRLPNGNTLVNYADGSFPKACEVTPDGEKVYEGDFDEYSHCYRAFRFEWDVVSPEPYLVVEPFPERVSLIFNKFGDTEADRYIIFTGLYPYALAPIDTTGDTIFDVTDLTNRQTWYFAVKALYENGVTSAYSNVESAYVNYILPGENYIQNGDFSDGSNEWSLLTHQTAVADGNIVNGEYFLDIIGTGYEIWHIELIQYNVPLIQGRTYKIEFDARAAESRTIKFLLQQNGDPHTNYSQTGSVVITNQMKHFEHEFTMQEPTDYYTRLNFQCGNNINDLWFDNISVIETGVSSIKNVEEIPTGFSLGQNYPNPFNPSTNINYSIAVESNVKLAIYNILGEEVAVLRQGISSPGHYSAVFNGSELVSGVYIYSINVAPVKNGKGFSESKKLLLVK